MELNLEIPSGHLFIRSITTDGIRVGDDYYDRPFIISRQQIINPWDVSATTDLGEVSLQPVFDLQPELVLIGCGSHQTFLPPAIQALFFQRGIGFEVMITDAACRTFNVLVAEGRNVVAGLIPG